MKTKSMGDIVVLYPINTKKCIKRNLTKYNFISKDISSKISASLVIYLKL